MSARKVRVSLSAFTIGLLGLVVASAPAQVAHAATTCSGEWRWPVKTLADPLARKVNFTPVTRTDYQVGVPTGGYWREMLNSDSADYGGGGQGNLGGVQATGQPWHGRPDSLRVVLPGLSCVYFKAPSRG